MSSMQFEESETEQESVLNFLVQQVQEQSYVCDVTVKLGHWEKNFHQCVLLTSPFFECALKENFIEKETGKIEISFGTPVTMEMAIMFLYGQKPNFTQENIEQMLQLAEYLIIPNLKSACIRWLKSTKVNEEDCMSLLQMSAIFNFDVPNCTEYIEGHLTEMLRNSQMVSLTNDSVHYLFTARQLSYVSMDDKLNFLVRWVKSRPDSRKTYLNEFLATIDFREVSKSLLHDIKDDKGLFYDIDFEEILRNLKDEISSCQVLIMKGENSEGSFWCFDEERQKWFRFDSRAFEEKRYYRYCEISGTGSNESEIYFIDKRYRKHNVLNLNLQLDTCRSFKIVEDSGEMFQLHNVSMASEIVVANVNEKVRTKRAENSLTWKRYTPFSYTETSTLYIGHLTDECIRMSPYLTFKDCNIWQICINKTLTVAILFTLTTFVTLFDLVDHKLEIIQLEIDVDSNDKLVESENGFVIYNGKRCISLTKQTGQLPSSKYYVKETSFHTKDFSFNKFYFSGNTWYHYYCGKDSDEQFKFESAPHSCFISERSTANIAWKPLPLPKEASNCHRETIKDPLFEIRLPRTKLRCDVECPHCKIKTETSNTTIVDVEDSFGDLYSDDDDDDIYE